MQTAYLIAVTVIATLLLAPMEDARAASSNILLNVVPESNCGQDAKRGFRLNQVSDGDPDTLWRVGWAMGSCELTFRFKEPRTVQRLELVDTYQPTGFLNTPPPLSVTIWASHQGFAGGFFKVTSFPFEQKATKVFMLERPMRMRSLKIMLRGRAVTGSDLRLAEVRAFESSSEVDARWPQPVMKPLSRNGDPLTAQTATLCDELAGYPFSPDSPGHSRLDVDLDVVEALRACEKALTTAPQSARLNFNMARINILAERAERAIARLTGPVLDEYPPAQYLLGLALINGHGVERDPARAKELMQKAADANFAPALLWLAQEQTKARSLATVEGKSTNDPAVIVPELERAVQLGYLPAYPAYFQHVMAHKQMSVADAYDLAEQASQYGQAADGGAYQVNLFNGYRGRMWRADAHRYMLRDARRNHPHSMTNYTIEHLSASNPGYWRRRAAYDGNYWSMDVFVRQQASDTSRDFLTRSAFNRAKADAEAGNDWSAEWLARYYDQGFGVEKDPEVARKWRCRARKLGNPVALSTSVNCDGIDP